MAVGGSGPAGPLSGGGRLITCRGGRVWPGIGHPARRVGWQGRPDRGTGRARGV